MTLQSTQFQNCLFTTFLSIHPLDLLPPALRKSQCWGWGNSYDPCGNEAKMETYFRHVTDRFLTCHSARSFLSSATYLEQRKATEHLTPIQSSAERRSAKRGRQCNAVADWLLSTQLNTAVGKTSSLAHIIAGDGGTIPRDLRRIPSGE